MCLIVWKAFCFFFSSDMNETSLEVSSLIGVLDSSSLRSTALGADIKRTLLTAFISLSYLLGVTSLMAFLSFKTLVFTGEASDKRLVLLPAKAVLGRLSSSEFIRIVLKLIRSWSLGNTSLNCKIIGCMSSLASISKIKGLYEGSSCTIRSLRSRCFLIAGNCIFL
jgi:hypothetical protein